MQSATSTRVEAFLDALQLIAQKPPQHDDAGIRVRQVFERVDRDRALPLLRFEIVGLPLPLLVAAFQDAGSRQFAELARQFALSPFPKGYPAAVLRSPSTPAWLHGMRPEGG
jgi:hypothetical protein